MWNQAFALAAALWRKHRLSHHLLLAFGVTPTVLLLMLLTVFPEIWMTSHVASLADMRIHWDETSLTARKGGPPRVSYRLCRASPNQAVDQGGVLAPGGTPSLCDDEISYVRPVAEIAAEWGGALRKGIWEIVAASGFFYVVLITFWRSILTGNRAILGTAWEFSKQAVTLAFHNVAMVVSAHRKRTRPGRDNED